MIIIKLNIAEHNLTIKDDEWYWEPAGSERFVLIGYQYIAWL